MPSTWRCPKCERAFTRVNQRHACGTGERTDVLRDRPPELVKLYKAIEKYAKTLGPIELVTRDRYVLFRSRRIFADIVMMTDAVRIAIHLGRKVEHPVFFKVVADKRHISHVAKLKRDAEWDAIKPLLAEAHAFSLR